MKHLIVSIAVGLVVGCSASGNYTIVSETPASIALQGAGTIWDDVPITQRMAAAAMDHCAKTGREAVLTINAFIPLTYGNLPRILPLDHQ